jgi:hypothetical protein
MDIRTVHDGQDLNLIGSHTFQRQVEALVRMNVREGLRIN